MPAERLTLDSPHLAPSVGVDLAQLAAQEREGLRNAGGGEDAVIGQWTGSAHL